MIGPILRPWGGKAAGALGAIAVVAALPLAHLALLQVPLLSQQASEAGAEPSSGPGVNLPPPPPPESQVNLEDYDTSNVISVDVSEVIIPVTVTDSEGRFVADLSEEDFSIYDNNVKQDIRFFNAERNQPVVVGFLMDLSNASKIRWDNYQMSAIELVLTILNGEDQYAGYLIGFGNQSEVLVDTTNSPDPIVERLQEVTPGGGAAFYDAIYQAITDRTLIPGEPFEPRRVIVVIGDGHDNASRWTREQVLELAQRNLVTIYAISTEAYGYTAESADNLRYLARATGGKVEYPLLEVYNDTQGFLSRSRDGRNIEFDLGTGGYSSVIANAVYGAIRNLTGEITTQYILRYVPSNSGEPGERHQVEVRVDLPAVEVRARTFYYTP